MYSCFVNSTITQANEINHSSKIAFLSLLLFIRFVEEFEEFIHFRNTLLFCFIDCERMALRQACSIPSSPPSLVNISG